MLDRAEIEAQLKDVPRDKCVAFAVRSAMRVLPLLVMPRNKLDSEAFWFWRNNKSKHLLAIFRAYSSGVECCLMPYSAARAAHAAHAAHAAYAAHAARAAAYDADIIQIIKVDLRTIRRLTVEQFLQQPLWPNSVPLKWQQLHALFNGKALSLDENFGIWLNWYDDRLTGKPVDTELLEKLNRIPPEIEEQGAAKIIAYLRQSLPNNATQPLNRVRSIFIGYGEAGKTSLIRALHDEEVVKGKEAMTAGIDIRNWPVPDTDIEAHFWDFGGQVVFHSTHKFFLRSSCVYVVVINARADINNSEQAEYWLDHVKVFGGSAPVLIVGNNP